MDSSERLNSKENLTHALLIAGDSGHIGGNFNLEPEGLYMKKDLTTEFTEDTENRALCSL